MTRLEIAVAVLVAMLPTGGTKEDKVNAALDYADLLIERAKISKGNRKPRSER